ncbi:hypothetical protein KEM54_005834 [Ascosphaera aggregata]|nr:hypothetical protein KEM54_005834 [Ascosphaera aggregata]
MSLITEYHDSLPYIDHDPSPAEREQISRLIASELSSEASTHLHPSIPTFPEPKFSTLIQGELDRKAANQPIKGGIDLTRYEAPEPPAQGAPVSEWRSVLQAAYASAAHLTTRTENLKLLEQNGKNVWLTSNAETEAVLKSLEKQVAELKEEGERINRERKLRQEGGKGELVALEEAWRKSISGIIEVEIAMENLRKAILERKRQMAR